MQRVACFILFFSLLFITNSSAQRFQAGLTAGGIASDIPGMDTRDNDADFTKLGYTVGALVSTAISSKALVQLEINYIQKGTAQKPDSLNNGSFRYSFNY